jgi:hypothetical protein
MTVSPRPDRIWTVQPQAAAVVHRLKGAIGSHLGVLRIIDPRKNLVGSQIAASVSLLCTACHESTRGCSP